jgi:hypothetical protein
MDGARRGRPGRGAGVVLAFAVAVLAGCGGPTPTPVAPAPTVTPTPTATPEEQALAWTESVCGALVPVVAGLTGPPGIDLGAPEATRQAYLTYLADGIATTDRARAALAAAGPAPVAGGDVLAEQVRGDVAELRTDLVDARTQVERAEPDSAVAVGRALVGASSLVRALLNGAEVAGAVNRDPLLRDAYGRAPSCARLQRSGAAPPTTAPAAVPTR